MILSRKIFSFLGIAALPFILFACIQGVKGNGQVEREVRSIEHFESLEISGFFDVYIRQGDSPDLEVVADENLLELIRHEVEAGELKVWISEDIRKAEKMEIYITYTHLSEINLSGAIDLDSKGVIENDEFSIDISGATDAKIALNVNHLNVDVSGAAELWLSGKAYEFDADISGAVDLDAYELETREIDMDLSGAGSAKLWVTEKLDAEVSGAGSIRYKGNPKSISKDISGAGSIRQID